MPRFRRSGAEDAFLWKIDLPGIGHGSPVVWDGKIFVLCANAETSERMPTCVNAADGSVLWSKTIKTGKFKGNKRNTPASSTAAVDAERVYFAWGTKEKLTMAAFSHVGEMLWGNGSRTGSGWPRIRWLADCCE